MIPILKKELKEIKEASIEKEMKFNLENMKYILSKFFTLTLLKVNQIEDALIAKGYEEQNF